MILFFQHHIVDITYRTHLKLNSCDLKEHNSIQSKFELAKNQMSAIQLYKVAKTFDVSVDSLFTDMTKSDYKKTIKQDIYAL